MNNKIVIDILKKQPPLSRANLSTITGLNRSTISSIISDLIDEGWVKETNYQSDKVGRPGLLLEINPGGGFAVGVEIGVDFILVVIIDFSAKVIWRKRIETDPNEGQIEIQEKAFKLTTEAIEIGKKECTRPLGIGIAIPGLVDVHDGVLKYAPNLHWKDVPLRLIWTQQFHLPVFIENDANAAALGEFYYGAAQGIDNFVYIAAGFGLGSGIIIDGKLLRGNKGYAAEVGHTTIDPEGEICSCGKRGCYETLIGPRAVIKRVKKLISEEGSKSTILHISDDGSDGFGYDAVVDAARKNDKVALEALEEVGCNLGIVVSNLVNIFDPKMVILGGALNYAKDYIQPVVIEVVKANALQLCQEDLVITSSQLDQDSSVMGAAGLILENIWNESNWQYR
ncbi:MAG: ROK family transcriptional regulator [Anaerolineaceae bacterium]|nr:ROK family transcriptional regulator [Anaerolineaceae bacterium]